MYRVYKKEVNRYVERCRKMLAIPYVWKEEKSAFEVEKSRNYVKSYGVLGWVMRGHFLLMCVAHGVAMRRETLQFQILSVGAMAVYFTNAYISTIHREAGNVVLLLNRVITYEAKFEKKGTKKNFFLTMFLNSVSLTTLSAALGLSCLALVDFRIPPFFGYFVYRMSEAFGIPIEATLEGKTFLGYGIPLRLVSGLLAAVGITPVVMSGTQIIVTEIFLGLLTFKRFLETLKDPREEKGPLKGRHDEKDQLKRLKMVRLLVDLFNEVYETKFFARGLAMGDSTLILASYCAIKMHKEVSSIEVALFSGVSVMGYVVLTFVLTLASKVWVESKVVLKGIAKKGKVQKDLRKELKSCPPLKVKLGKTNFVDRMTPIIFLSFTMEQIVSIALVKN